MPPRHIFAALVTALSVMAAALAAGCSSTHSDKPIVTVSIEPQKWMLEQITGDRVTVRTLIANGANPETYDPSLTHILNLNKSIALLRMGNIGFEAAMLDKIRQEQPDLPIYNTSLGITPITDTHSHGDHEHSVVDPHTWTSVKNARVIARNMLTAMEEIDPAHKTYYRNNYERFDAHLDSLDRAIAERIARGGQEAFMVWHPSLSYMARDYGLTQLVGGGHENKEISVGTLRRAIADASARGVRVFFFQKEFDSRQADALAEELGGMGVERVEINPMSYDWEQEILTIADALSRQEP